MSEKRFVIADIHGCLNTFKYLVEDIIKPKDKDQIFLLGDYINKGPDSKGVIDYIFYLKKKGYRVKVLRGNHEQILLDALEGSASPLDFYDKGGINTLRSFYVDSIQKIPEEYIRFIRSLEYFIELPDYFLVHAGFNFALQDPFSDKDAMINMRNMAIPPKFSRKIIHGHIPLPLHQVIENVNQNENYNVHLDCGCVYPYRNGMGFLAALELNSFKLYVKECIDDIP